VPVQFAFTAFACGTQATGSGSRTPFAFEMHVRSAWKSAPSLEDAHSLCASVHSVSQLTLAFVALQTSPHPATSCPQAVDSTGRRAARGKTDRANARSKGRSFNVLSSVSDR